MPLLKQKGQFLLSGPSGLTANGVGLPWRVQGCDDVMLQITSTGSGACTIKVQASLTGQNPYDTAPNFSVSASSTSQWFYSPTLEASLVPSVTNVVAGSTGFVLAGNDATNTKTYSIVIPSAEWISVEISNYTAGTIIVRGHGFAA